MLCDSSTFYVNEHHFCFSDKSHLLTQKTNPLVFRILFTVYTLTLWLYMHLFFALHVWLRNSDTVSES